MTETVEYIFISVPDESPSDDMLKLINEKTSGMSTNFVLPLPDLKIGSLDALVSTSDHLTKADTYASSVVQKMMEFTLNLLGPDDHEQLLVGPARVPMETFIQHFQWDESRYPLRLQLVNMVEVISKVITQADTTFKQKATAHNTIVQRVQAIEKKSMGNLMTRSLDELVSADKFVLDSEYLETLLVVVPKLSMKEWLSSYERLTEMVVPRSSELVAEDSEYCLYTVTLFKKVIDEFKMKAREMKCVVRDFKFSIDSQDVASREKRLLHSQFKSHLGPTIHWLKVNFNVIFSAWIHLKCLRVLVESILRYGLSNKLLTLVMKVHQKSGKLRKTLDGLFAHLDVTFIAKEIKEEEMAHVVIPGQIIESEYHPLVMFAVHVVPSKHSPPPRRGSRQQVQTTDAAVQLDGETVVRLPRQLAGKPFVIQKCRNCTIVILDSTSRVTVQDCTNCKVFVAACKERLLLDDCVDCQLFAATRQLVARWCVHCEIHLLCPTQPLLRSSVDMLFGCLQCSYAQMKGHLDSIGLSVFTNFWSHVSETTKIEDDDTSTWGLYPPETTASMELPSDKALGDVAISFSKEYSMIPHTLGPQQRPQGEGCLVVFFCHTEIARQKANQFFHQLKHQSQGWPPLLLIQTAETSFRAEEAQWLSHHPSFTPLGGCIVAEVCGDNSVERCRDMVATIGAEAYVSPSPQQAATDVENFTKYITAKLTVLTKQQIGKSMSEKLDSESMLSQPL